MSKTKADTNDKIADQISKATHLPDTPDKAGNGRAWKTAVGIGSAALVAALMYAGRRATRKR